jgi:ribosome-binding protein aMBF1 (putative translation factor)
MVHHFPGADNSNRAVEWLPDWGPEDRAEIERIKGELRKARPIVRRLRQALGLSQAEAASILETTQSNVSKIEAKRDPTVSVLRRLIEAKGGRLQVTALLADGTELKLIG